MQKIQRKYWLNTTGTQQKRSVAQLMFNREKMHWPSSGQQTHELGWVLGCLISFAQPLVGLKRTDIWKGKHTTSTVIPTPAYDAIKKQLMDEAVLFAPMSWPMLIEPNDWTNRPAWWLLAQRAE